MNSGIILETFTHATANDNIMMKLLWLLTKVAKFTFLLSKFVFTCIIITWTTDVVMMEMLLLILMNIMISLSQPLEECPQTNGSSSPDTTQCPPFFICLTPNCDLDLLRYEHGSWAWQIVLPKGTFVPNNFKISQCMMGVTARTGQNVPPFDIWLNFVTMTSDIWTWSCVWHIVLPLTFCAKHFQNPLMHDEFIARTHQNVPFYYLWPKFVTLTFEVLT